MCLILKSYSTVCFGLVTLLHHCFLTYKKGIKKYVTHRIILSVKWDIVDTGHSVYKILDIIYISFHYMVSNLKFSVVYNNKYLFLFQVHLVTCCLDVILLQTASWVTSTYILILRPKLKKRLMLFWWQRAQKPREFWNLSIPQELLFGSNT